MYKLLLSLSLALVSCSGGGETIPPEFLHDPDFYFGESNEVTLNVYYEEGAAPFVGAINTANPTLNTIWDITLVNLEEIFSFKDTSATLNVPVDLSEMVQMEVLNQETWTVEDMIDLARDRDIVSKNELESIFSVFFVKGFFEDDDGVKNNVVGVNVSGTSITIIFKDVLLNMPVALRVFSEQATVIHEVGHALGLVDNGVPATGAHFDGLNGAHSNEDDCIMFHLNEGAADLIPFITNLNTTGDATIWGLGVLSDVEAFSN